MQFSIFGLALVCNPLTYGQGVPAASAAVKPLLKQAAVQATTVNSANPFLRGKPALAVTPRPLAVKPASAVTSITPAPTTLVLPLLPAVVGPPSPGGTPSVAPSQLSPPLCKVEAIPFNGKIGYLETELSLQFKHSLEKPCLTAVSADDDWVEPQLNRETNTVTLYVSENSRAVARTTTVYVVAGTQSFSYKVRQGAGTVSAVAAVPAAAQAPEAAPVVPALPGTSLTPKEDVTTLTDAKIEAPSVPLQ